MNGSVAFISRFILDAYPTSKPNLSEGHLYDIYEIVYPTLVKRLKKALAAKKARPASKKSHVSTLTARSSSSSTALVRQLRERLGERHLVEILKVVRDEYYAVHRHGREEEGDADISWLRANNAVRLHAKRQAIFADALNSDEAGALISRSRPVVNKMAKKRELLAVVDGRALRFPRWQFDNRTQDGLVPGFKQILSVMEASDFRIASWLISEHPRLGNKTPIDLLRHGDIDRVYREAKAVTSG